MRFHRRRIKHCSRSFYAVEGELFGETWLHSSRWLFRCSIQFALDAWSLADRSRINGDFVCCFQCFHKVNPTNGYCTRKRINKSSDESFVRDLKISKMNFAEGGTGKSTIVIYKET